MTTTLREQYFNFWKKQLNIMDIYVDSKGIYAIVDRIISGESTVQQEIDKLEEL